MRTTRFFVAATAAAMLVPATAGAHVTVQPKEAAAGAFTVEKVRVPNEESDASTTKVELQLPDGFASVSYQPVPGWSAKVTKTKLATPVQTDDGEVTEQVSRITWTADSDADAIGPGQFMEFPLSVQIPGEEGDTLTFKALQTYSDGTVVRWIGAPDSDHPAPQVAVTAAAADDAAGSSDDDSDGASKGLAIAALAAGLLGLVAGIGALARTRRR